MATPARTREIRKSLLNLIEELWNPTAPSEVVSSYRYDIFAKDLTGRKVMVIPEAYTGFPATKGEDDNDYGYQVWVARRYEGGQGNPPDEWVDGELDFVAELANRLGEARLSEDIPVYMPDQPNVYPLEADVTTVFDIVELTENKLFVAVLTLLLREDN